LYLVKRRPLEIYEIRFTNYEERGAWHKHKEPVRCTGQALCVFVLPRG
jgi:hypothetical protein